MLSILGNYRIAQLKGILKVIYFNPLILKIINVELRLNKPMKYNPLCHSSQNSLAQPKLVRQKRHFQVFFLSHGALKCHCGLFALTSVLGGNRISLPLYCPFFFGCLFVSLHAA